MAEEPDEIKQHIDSTRAELGANLHELEARVKRAVNWRTYVERWPFPAVGAAVLCGVMTPLLMGRSKGRKASAPVT